MKLRERTIREESVKVPVENARSQSASPASIANPATRVVLNIDHAQPHDLGGGPSFRITLRNWTADGEISIHLVGPKGEIVTVVPPKQPIHASPEGNATVTVPYKHRGLYPGMWLLMVAGPSGIHQCKVEIPKVMPRDSERKEERLVFKTRNTLSSSLPYHFGVYEPPAQRPGHQNAINLQQKEVDLNRRAAELEQKAAELEKKETEMSGKTAAASNPRPTARATMAEQVSPAPSGPPSVHESANEREAGPSESIIRKLGQMRPEQSFKRGRTLVSRGGTTPIGTLIYPIQIIGPSAPSSPSMLPSEGRVVATFYAFENEFGDWACFNDKGQIFDKNGRFVR